MPAVVRPRRSVLYMPGSNARALEKATSLPGWTVISMKTTGSPCLPRPEARKPRGEVVDTARLGMLVPAIGGFRRIRGPTGGALRP
jgi:citrate lyase subunit beta/citryl-CoA lyase